MKSASNRLAMLLGAVSLGKGVFEHGYTMPSAVGGLGFGVMAGALTLPHDGTEALYTVIGSPRPCAWPPAQLTSPPSNRSLTSPSITGACVV